MKTAILLSIITGHIAALLLYMHFCVDASNAGVWRDVYFLSDPASIAFLCGWFYLAKEVTTTEKQFILTYSLFNFLRFIAYKCNSMGVFDRTYNFYLLTLGMLIASILILISGIRHGNFKRS